MRGPISCAQRKTSSSTSISYRNRPLATTLGLRLEARWKRVTTPKNPGPAPRAAHSRSAFSSRVGVHERAVGGDEVDRLDAHAGRAVHAAVPAVAALQQVAADARRPRSGRPGRTDRARAERGEELVSGTPGLHGRASSRAVDHLGGPQAREVEQHAAVAQVVAGPAVPARAHADPACPRSPARRTARTTSASLCRERRCVREALGRARVPQAARRACS